MVCPSLDTILAYMDDLQTSNPAAFDNVVFWSRPAEKTHAKAWAEKVNGQCYEDFFPEAQQLIWKSECGMVKSEIDKLKSFLCKALAMKATRRAYLVTVGGKRPDEDSFFMKYEREELRKRGVKVLRVDAERLEVVSGVRLFWLLLHELGGDLRRWWGRKHHTDIVSD